MNERYDDKGNYEKDHEVEDMINDANKRHQKQSEEIDHIYQTEGLGGLHHALIELYKRIAECYSSYCIFAIHSKLLPNYEINEPFISAQILYDVVEDIINLPTKVHYDKLHENKLEVFDEFVSYMVYIQNNHLELTMYKSCDFLMNELNRVSFQIYEALIDKGVVKTLPKGEYV
jgi:hypothetical protein